MSKILNISEAASLALHTMVLIATQPERRVANREIATALQASENHLSKVLQRLTRSGLLRSTRGPRGGFILGRDAAKITLLEIYESIDGPIDETGCLFNRSICNGTNCFLGSLLHDLSQTVRNHFGDSTLEQFLDRPMPLRLPKA